jgi:hypothetical protein
MQEEEYVYGHKSTARSLGGADYRGVAASDQPSLHNSTHFPFRLSSIFPLRPF